MSEFLFCEVPLIGGIEGFPQTSTWFLSRTLLLELPFTKALKGLQDIDWLLRASSHLQLQVAWVPEPLAVFHNSTTSSRVGSGIDWEFSYEWAMKNKDLFTREAIGFFLVIYCLNPAARCRAPWPTLVSILRDCQTYGKLTPRLWVLISLYLAVYPHARRITSREFERRMHYKITNALGAVHRSIREATPR
jgi:hypothetical protein